MRRVGKDVDEHLRGRRALGGRRGPRRGRDRVPGPPVRLGRGAARQQRRGGPGVHHRRRAARGAGRVRAHLALRLGRLGEPGRADRSGQPGRGDVGGRRAAGRDEGPRAPARHRLRADRRAAGGHAAGRAHHHRLDAGRHDHVAAVRDLPAAEPVQRGREGAVGGLQRRAGPAGLTGTRARWAAMLGAAAAVSAVLAATGWLAPSRHPAAAQEPSGCTILQAENERDGAPTTLRLLSLPGGTTKRLTQAGYWINAMGYSASQGVVYGVADGTRRGRYDHGSHAVRIDASGSVTDLGVVGRAGAQRPVWSQVTGATAGAIAGNRWYVRQDSDLYTVDIDPASADYVRVVHRTALRPVSLAVGVDDFAYDPASGLLY